MIKAVILAAGKSERFGRNKLLEPIDGKPIIRWIVESTLNSEVDEVIVVLGFEADKVGRVIEDLPCKKIINPNYESGMSSSVKFGVRNVMEFSEAILIIPGDCPLINKNSINMVIKKYMEVKASIIVATYKGMKGHPILIDKSLFQEIMEISEEKMGLKEVVKKHQEKVLYVETGDPGVILDIDNQEDLEIALRILRGF